MIKRNKKRRKNPESNLKTQIIQDFESFIENYNIETYQHIYQFYDQSFHEIKYLLKNIDFIKRIDSGGFGTVYLIHIINKILIQNVFLKSGYYALKINDKFPLYELCYSKLKKISNSGIIPQIYVLNPYFTIMDFIEGITFEEFEKKYFKYKEIDYSTYQFISEKHKKLINIFKILFKEDLKDPEFAKIALKEILCSGNILVSKDFKKVYLIDPC